MNRLIVMIWFSIFSQLLVPAIPWMQEVFAEEGRPLSEARALLLVETVSGESGAVHPAAFHEDSKPGAGKRLAIYAEASENCSVLAVAINPETKKLANGWLPEIVEGTNQETRLPQASREWNWNEGSDSFEFYIGFIPKADPSFEEIKKLVEAMQNSGGDPKLLDFQSLRLRDQILAMKTQDPAFFSAGEIPSAWGGTLRGATFEWRPMAKTTAFSSNQSGFILYQYAPSEAA